jgi:hypothetical protein
MHKQILAATVLFAAGLSPVAAASIDKSIDVQAPASAVWKKIGAFCSIKDWHPAIGTCTESGGVRTLTTKDGKAQFVEKRVALDKKEMSYSYEIEKSPLPITNYRSTLKVVPTGEKTSKVDWSSTYTPDEGKADAAQEALAGIYQAGLDNIQKTVGK